MLGAAFLLHGNQPRRAVRSGDICASASAADLTAALREIPSRGLDQHEDAYRPPAYVEGMLELIDTLASIGWPTNQAEVWHSLSRTYTLISTPDLPLSGTLVRTG